MTDQKAEDIDLEEFEKQEPAKEQREEEEEVEEEEEEEEEEEAEEGKGEPGDQDPEKKKKKKKKKKSKDLDAESGEKIKRKKSKDLTSEGSEEKLKRKKSKEKLGSEGSEERLERRKSKDKLEKRKSKETLQPEPSNLDLNDEDIEAMMEQEEIEVNQLKEKEEKEEKAGEEKDPKGKKGKGKKGKGKKGKEEEEETGRKVGFHELFRFADRLDYLLMFIGVLCAMGHGVLMPLFAVFFGDVIDSFQVTVTNPDPEAFAEILTDTINDIALKFVILAAVAAVTSFLQVSCLMFSGQRQATRLRNRYFQFFSFLFPFSSFLPLSLLYFIITCLSRALLAQEVGWYDVNESGELTARIAGFPFSSTPPSNKTTKPKPNPNPTPTQTKPNPNQTQTNHLAKQGFPSDPRRNF